MVRAREPEAARALIAFLASPTTAAAIREIGMEPMIFRRAHSARL